MEGLHERVENLHRDFPATGHASTRMRGGEKPSTSTPTLTTATPVLGEPVLDSEISGIDNYSIELGKKMISDTTELENIDLGLIDETTFNLYSSVRR
ncbi:MAG: hypothetical protein QXL78_06760 [Methanocellales archaeon]